MSRIYPKGLRCQSRSEAGTLPMSEVDIELVFNVFYGKAMLFRDRCKPLKLPISFGALMFILICQ
jgi:hypothetical protein